MDNDSKIVSSIKKLCKEYVAASEDKGRAANSLIKLKSLKADERMSLIDAIKMAENSQEEIVKRLIIYCTLL